MLYFSKIDHFKRVCHERDNNEDSIQISISFDDDSYESTGMLVVLSLETEEGWVIDPCCSYQMCQRKEYFETLNL